MLFIIVIVMMYRRRAKAVSFISLLLSIRSYKCYNPQKYYQIYIYFNFESSLVLRYQFINYPFIKYQKFQTPHSNNNIVQKYTKLRQAMLNPKHIMQLHQAIELILGPHSNVQAHLVNSYIQKGEQILHNLRMTQSYSYLLGHFLNQGASTGNNIFNVDKKNELSTNNNGFKKNSSYAKMFVLLELSKIVSLDNQSVWWHLLECYYTCPERLQTVIIDIVIKHFNMGEAKLSKTYQPFLYYLNANTLNMTNLSKMLNLAYRLMLRLCAIIQSDLYSKNWKIQHIQYMTQTLQYLLTILKDQCSYNNFIEIVTVYILRFVMLANQLTGSKSDSGQVQFRQKQLDMINESISLKNNKLIYTLVYLTAETKNQYLDPHPFYTSQSNTFNNVVCTLQELMRVKGRRNSHYVQAYKIIVYFLLKIKHNREMLQKYRHTLMKMYYNYIVQVEVKKPSSQVINDQVQTNKEFEEEDTGANGEISYYCKYLLLSQCIKLNSAQLMQSLIKKSQISVIVYLAYSMSVQPSTQILQIISVYLQSTINHPFSKSTPTIICCLRYLYRFDLSNNFPHLIPICTTLLNLRATYSEFQSMVDMILCKVTLNIVTCTQENQLWDFVSIWVSNLQHNYMDVNAISFYPVLLIFEALSDYRFFQYAESNHIKNKSEYQIDFPSFFDQLLDLLIEQSQLSKQSIKNRKKQAEPVWSDNFEIFYKLSAVIVRYICTQKKYNSRISMKMAGCQNCKQTRQINRIVQKSLSHIFKNQLYCTDTAYLYFHSLITKNDVNGIIQFMGNMMTESFWSGFDTNEIIFYACVFMALCHHYDGKGVFESPEMLSNLMNILQKIFNSQAFPEQSTSKIRSQLNQFTNLLTFSELKDDNIQCFNSENMKNNWSRSKTREQSMMNEQYQISRQQMNTNIYN